MSVWSKRITETGAFWGMVTGFGVNVGMNALSLAGFVEWPVIADPILVGVVSSYIAVRIASKPGGHSIVASTYRDALHQMPAHERDPLVIQQTLVWPKVMVAMGVLIAVAMTLFYALPYGHAVAQAEQMALGVIP